MTTMLTGTCECGTQVTRPADTGPMAKYINAIRFTCQGCNTRYEAQRAAEEEARREQERAEARARRTRVAGIPQALRGVDLDKLDATDNPAAIADARAWAAGRIPGLVLTGAPGTGKTTVAAGALISYVRRNNGRWVSAPELLLKLGSKFGDQDRTSAMDALLGGDALVIDDIDKIRPTEYGAELLFVAIDNCIANCRPLLVTTNLGLDDLASRYPSAHGDAIASRLAGLGARRMVGRDRRLS